MPSKGHRGKRSPAAELEREEKRARRLLELSVEAAAREEAAKGGAAGLEGLGSAETRP